MKKIIFFFVITILSFNVYASNIQVCDAYNVFEEYRAKVTIEYYPDLDHYKISYKDIVFYFQGKSESGSSYYARREGYSEGRYTRYKYNNNTEEMHYINVTKDGREYDLDFKNCEYVK